MSEIAPTPAVTDRRYKNLPLDPRLSPLPTISSILSKNASSDSTILNHERARTRHHHACLQ
jgi:hypothetical protein